MTKTEQMINVLESAQMMLSFADKKEVLNGLYDYCCVQHDDIKHKGVYLFCQSEFTFLHPSLAINNAIEGVKKHGVH